MAMPKLSLVDAIATGATIKNPSRHLPRETLEMHPLGPPSPDIIAEGLADHWRFFVQSIPWITEADRRLVEIACLYRANFWKHARFRSPIVDDSLTLSGNVIDDGLVYFVDHKATTVELRIIEKLGGTPTSRPKVAPPGEGGGNPKGKAGKRRDQWW